MAMKHLGRGCRPDPSADDTTRRRQSRLRGDVVLRHCGQQAGSGYFNEFGAPSLAPGVSRTFPITSANSYCGIPDFAQAYSLNITVIPPGPLGFLTVWPTGQARPLAATLTSLQGSIVSCCASTWDEYFDQTGSHLRFNLGRRTKIG